MAVPSLLPNSRREQTVQGMAAPLSLRVELVLLPMLSFSGKQQLPSSQHSTQGTQDQLQANSAMGAPMDPGQPAGEGSSVVWSAGEEQGGDRGSQEERQRSSMLA